MATNIVYGVRARNKHKQPHVIMYTVLYSTVHVRVFSQIPDVAAHVHTLGLRGLCAQQKCSEHPRAVEIPTVHGERGRIGNSEIFACNVFRRGCKYLKMSKLIV